jgi:transcriptional regulator with XRE-family HTH domain
MRSSQPSDHPLRAWRLERRLSLADVAREVSSTAATISRIETGRHFPKPELLRRLCDTTEIGIEPFFVANRPR